MATKSSAFKLAIKEGLVRKDSNFKDLAKDLGFGYGAIMSQIQRDIVGSERIKLIADYLDMDANELERLKQLSKKEKK